MKMRITCDQCDKTYVVPNTLVGNERRLMRCGDCGARWWHSGSVDHAERTAGQGDAAVLERPDTGSETGLDPDAVDVAGIGTFAEGGTMADDALATRSDTAMIVLRDGGESHADPDRNMRSFFDGIASRFAPQPDNLTSFSSQRFQKLKYNRQIRIERDQESSIVNAEFREIRDYGELIAKLRTWVMRGAILMLIAGSVAFALIRG